MTAWIIDGVDKATGKEKTLRLSAATEDDAGSKARMSGMLIERIRPDAPPKAVTAGPDVPDYTGLKLVGVALCVWAFAALIGAFAGLLDRAAKSDMAGGVAYLFAGITASVVLFALASAGWALRDIARNSYRA